MSNQYARQSDLDKLTTQVDRFVEKVTDLIITKELHEVAQKAISEKLTKIETLIEGSQVSLEERLKTLEESYREQKNFRKFVYMQATVVLALTSIHWKTLGSMILKAVS